MKHITVLQGQTIFDIATQEYGHVSGVDSILKDNPQLENINADLEAGDKILISGSVIDQERVDYFQKNSIKVVSGIYRTGGFSDGFSNGFKK